MRIAAVAAALAGLSLTTPLIANAQLSRPKIDTVGGHVVRVMNPGPTAWVDTNGWKLVLERTIQPKDGEPGELANPFTVLRTSAGQYIVGDFRAPSITLFDANGKFLRALGRAGEGPGEYRLPFIGLYRDTLVIHDTRLGRLTLMTLDGRAVRSFSAKSTSCCEAVQLDRAGRVRIPSFGRSGAIWNFYDLKGQALDSIRPPVVVPPLTWKYTSGGGSGTQGIPLGPWNTHRLLADGTILHGSTGTYSLYLSRTGSDTVRIFGRTGVVGASVPQSLRDSMFHISTDNNPEVRAVAKPGDIPHQFPLWAAGFEDAQGNFWILADGSPLGPRRFDVFTRDGRFLGAISAPSNSPQVSVLGDRVAVIDTDDNDLPRVRIYRIDRRGK